MGEYTKRVVDLEGLRGLWSTGAVDETGFIRWLYDSLGDSGMRMLLHERNVTLVLKAPCDPALDCMDSNGDLVEVNENCTLCIGKTRDWIQSEIFHLQAQQRELGRKISGLEDQLGELELKEKEYGK